jgi:hypothetical protein
MAMAVSKKTRTTGKKKQTAVNEVPLTKELQAELNSFLQAVHYDEWNDGGRTAEASVLIFRPSAIEGSVDVNVANEGWDDKLQNEVVNAVHKALHGKALFHSFD